MSEFPDMTARDLDGLSEIFRYYAEVETPRLVCCTEEKCVKTFTH